MYSPFRKNVWRLTPLAKFPPTLLITGVISP